MEEKWLNKELKSQKVVSETDYLKLSAGIMTAKQVNELFASSNVVSFINNKKKLLYYKQALNLTYTPAEIGDIWGSYLEDKNDKRKIDEIFLELSEGKKDKIRVVDSESSKKNCLVHTYSQVVDKTGKFVGILEELEDIYPLVDLYLKQTGQKLTDDPQNLNQLNESDASSGASEMWT